jgi:hypothetical protein
MTCEKYERWISDALDGELPEKAGAKLAAHLAGCPVCRAYKERLGRLQKAATSQSDAPVAPGYWDEFSDRLRARMLPREPERRPSRPLIWGWRWAWLAVPAALAAAFIGLGILRQGPVVGQDVFSYEVFLNGLAQDTAEDTELVNSFDEVILGSLEEEVGSAALDVISPFDQDPFYWDNLSDDEVRLIDQEIRKELKS